MAGIRTIGHITLRGKCAGARSAGKPHAACDVAGAGNGLTVRLVRHSHRKRGETDRPRLRDTAPALDPIDKLFAFLRSVPRGILRRCHHPWSERSTSTRVPLTTITELFTNSWLVISKSLSAGMDALSMYQATASRPWSDESTKSRYGIPTSKRRPARPALANAPAPLTRFIVSFRQACMKWKGIKR